MKRLARIFDYALMAGIAALIIVFAFLREQSFLKTLPTLITLVVLVLLANASRFAFLLGGANALLYGISYFSEGLYFSLASAVLISAPIQFYSFFAWSRQSRSGDTPALKFLRKRHLLAALIATVLGWLGCYFGLSWLFEGQSYPLIDTFSFVLGITVSLLAAWRYIESQYLNIIGTALGLVLWILLTVRDPANFNYVIISAYNMYRCIHASMNWTIKYLRQKKKRSS